MSVEIQLTVSGASHITFKIGHVSPNVRVESVDDHFPVRGSGYLNSAIHQTRRWLSAPPVLVVANVLSLREEIWQVSVICVDLTLLAELEKVLAGRLETAMQDCKEVDGFLGEDSARGFVAGAKDGDTV